MGDCQVFRHDSPQGVSVRGYLHRPDTRGTEPGGKDGLVLTHGAGANCQAPLLVALARVFCASGFTVLRCDLPFRQARPHGPPPRGSAERDQQGLRLAAECMRGLTPAHVFLGGHSYGGRQASMLAADEPGIAAALLLLSYPLHPPQRPEELRTAHLSRLETPALFVHGVRDGVATSDELAAAVRLIPASTRILSVLGAGHELLSKKNSDSLPENIVQAFRSLTGASA
jgi:predicted alpha/beta-hydrolase family hydrolase